MEEMIDFRAGYWEWLVFVGDECVYTFGDLGDEIPNPCTYDELQSVVSDLIDLMRYVFWAGEYSIDPAAEAILNSNLDVLHKKMVDHLSWEYAIV